MKKVTCHPERAGRAINNDMSGMEVKKISIVGRKWYPKEGYLHSIGAIAKER